jgi:hypothetical protein
MCVISKEEVKKRGWWRSGERMTWLAKGGLAMVFMISRERGDNQIKVGQQTFPVKEVRIEAITDESGFIHYEGTFTPDRLEGYERNALNRVVHDGRPFKIITKEDGELPYMCKKGPASIGEFESGVFTFKAKRV